MRLTSIEPDDEGLGEGLEGGFGEPVEEGSTCHVVHGHVPGELLERDLRLTWQAGDSVRRGSFLFMASGVAVNGRRNELEEEKGGGCEVDLRDCHHDGGPRRRGWRRGFSFFFFSLCL